VCFVCMCNLYCVCAVFTAAPFLRFRAGAGVAQNRHSKTGFQQLKYLNIICKLSDCIATCHTKQDTQQTKSKTFSTTSVFLHFLIDIARNLPDHNVCHLLPTLFLFETFPRFPNVSHAKTMPKQLLVFTFLY